jgi:hypothetical protein
MAEITFVKGETPASDRTYMTMPDGTARRVAVHVVHDLPHLVVESLFGLDDGLWGVLARGGFAAANRAATARDSRRGRLVTDAEFDDLAAANWPGHRVAKAATNAVTNRWGDGPDTPAGVRARLRDNRLRERDSRSGVSAEQDTEDHRRRMTALAGNLDDATIQHAIDGVRELFRQWAVLPPGESLRLAYPWSGTSSVSGSGSD